MSGIAFWNADAVLGTTITVDYSYLFQVTASDAAAPTHTYTTTNVIDRQFVTTQVGTRNTDFTTTPTDSEFRIVTGEGIIGAGTSPIAKLMRALNALTYGDTWGQAYSHLVWTGISYTDTLTDTYTGPGAPPNGFIDNSGTDGILRANFDFAAGMMDWLIRISPFVVLDVTDSAAVDWFTFKKGGSDNFGFTFSDVVPDPGTYGGLPTTAWNVRTDVTVTVS